MPTKMLIVNADDFGQSAGTNAGIMRAHEYGIVSSASLMVKCKGAASAASWARQHAALGVGLHVDLGEMVFRDGEWIWLYEVVDLGDIDAVQAEIDLQLKMFVDIMGRRPTHIDSHQHVHMREAHLLPLFAEMAKGQGATLRRCSAKVRYCGDFYGQLYDGTPYHSAITVQALVNLIRTLPAGYTELACHPSSKTDMISMYAGERITELNTLCDPEIRNELQNAQVVLCTFEGLSY